MEQTSTPLFFYSRTWLKAFVLAVILLSPVVVQAQTTIFKETVGNSTSTSISGYQTAGGFDNSNTLSFSGTAAVGNTASNRSKDYAEASSGSYVDFGTKSSSFIIGGINTTDITNIKLGFGVNIGSNNTLTVEYSTNGIEWTALPYSLPSAGSGWQYMKAQNGVVIPATENLRLRFSTVSGSRAVRVMIDDIILSPPIVTGFSPVSGARETEVTVYGKHLDIIYDIYMPTSGSIAVATNVSYDSITFILPADAETSVIELYDADVNLIATTTDEFVVIRPTISSFTPTSGSPKPVGAKGDEVTIKGTNLLTTEFVVFGGGGSEKPHFTDDSTVKVYIPDDAVTGAIDVITKAYGTATSSASFTVLKPKITKLSKNNGKVGETIYITGERLNVAPYAVTFEGGATATVTSNSLTQLAVTVPSGAESGVVTVTTAEGTAVTSSSFSVVKPGFMVQNTPLDPFTTKAGVPSDPQFYAIAGSNLEGSLNIAVPSQFEVSGDEGATWTTEGLSYIPDANGTVTQKNIFVRYNPSAKGTHSGTIANTSASLTELIAVSGSTLDPTITLTGTLSDFATEAGTPSASQSYTVSGTNMESGITVAGPASGEFKVSLDNTTFTRTLLVPLPAGSTSIEATVYVRYEPSESGINSAVISHTATNATTEELTVNGSTSKSSLPVELVSFKAENKASEVTLLWATASEKDNSHFEVEMSANPETGFMKIGKVSSKVGNSAVATNYLLRYSLTEAGTHYFRLKQVDLDGTATYSNVVAVEIKATAGARVMVAPNPLNYNSKVFINAAAHAEARLELHNVAGKRVYRKAVEVKEGQNEIQLPLYDQLQNGLYILTVELQGQRHQVKVVKQ